MNTRDQKVIWHPYTQHGLNADMIAVKSAQGSTLTLEDGSTVIDAISSWWVNIHGHGHPAIVQAIAKQAQTLDHIIFSGFTHSPAIELAEKILEATRARDFQFSKVFYSDNGSTAVEVALKMAFQFHKNKGDSKRTRFLALRGSYHGDTLGAMAVCEPDGFHSTFQPLMPKVDFIEPGDLSDLKFMLEKNGETLAAFIFEPLIQGASGMRCYSADYLQAAVKACQQAGILTIADEVFTGFYRSGNLFASELAQISPDLMCLSKGITGGVLPLAVTLASERIYEGFKSKEIRQALLHGHSYTANPIACAAACASWDLLIAKPTQDQIASICSETKRYIDQLKANPKIKNAWNFGTIGAIELKSNKDYFSQNPGQIMAFARRRGVLLRPLGNIIYTVPPFCVTQSELKQIYQVIEEIIYEF